MDAKQDPKEMNARQFGEYLANLNPDIKFAYDSRWQGNVAIWCGSEDRWVPLYAKTLAGGQWIRMGFEYLVNGERPAYEWTPVAKD